MDTRSRTAQYLVHTASDAGIPGHCIPTLGHPASAMEMYRVAAIETTGHEGWNSCFTDFTVPAALARLVEGPVVSMSDLIAAETALQALMWHERIDILVPAFRLDQAGFVGYVREADPRSELAFRLFEPAAPYDQLFVAERILASEGRAEASNIEGSTTVGRLIEDARSDYLAHAPFEAAVLSSVPASMGVPAYFAHPLLRPYTGKRAFFGEFYTAVAKQWDDGMRVVPDLVEVIPVPPLTAIVMDRAPSRDALPAAIHELRAELSNVRLELQGFGDMVRGAYNQAEVERRCQDIRRSFEASFRASRYPTPSFLLPLLKLYKCVKSPLDALIKALNPLYEPEDPRVLADRTVTSRTFQKLLRVDAMHSLLGTMLTATEIRRLEQSASRSRQT